MTSMNRLGDYTDAAATSDRLANHGTAPVASDALADLFRTSADLLLTMGCSAEEKAVSLFVPGRIEVLGKHTDYAGGRSLLAAAERGFCLLAVPRIDGLVRIGDGVLGESVEFELSPDLAPGMGHWSNYPMTVARRLSRNFPECRTGLDISFASNLPAAAGMSSSSALMVGTFLAMADINHIESHPGYRENIDSGEALAGYLGCVENGQDFGTLAGDRGVGTFGGSEDHTAMLCARPGQVVRYAYAPVRFEEAIPMPDGYSFAIACSGIAANKTGDAREAYNRASQLATLALEAWNRATGRSDRHLGEVVASGPDAIERMRDVLRRAGHAGAGSQELLDRFEHFVLENVQILPDASDSLRRADLVEFGRHVDRSQFAGETLLKNQVPQTVALTRIARRLGAPAASAFGAGFGGSVWALVDDTGAGNFLDEWASHYREEHPRQSDSCRFLLTGAGPGALRLT
jgi:galactokinase